MITESVFSTDHFIGASFYCTWVTFLNGPSIASVLIEEYERVCLDLASPLFIGTRWRRTHSLLPFTALLKWTRAAERNATIPKN